MKIEARKVHLLDAIDDVQTVEPNNDSPMQFGIDPRAFAGLEELRERFAFEGPDHMST